MTYDKLDKIFEKIVPWFLFSIFNLGIGLTLYVVDKCKDHFGWVSSEISWQSFYLWFGVAFFVILLMLILSPIFLALIENLVKKITLKYEQILKEGQTNGDNRREHQNDTKEHK